MKTVKKFEPLSVMKISAIGYSVLGLFEGGIFSLIFTIMPLADRNHQLPRSFGFLFGGLSIILFPILFAVMGALCGGLGAVIYNVSARLVSGIMVEVE